MGQMLMENAGNVVKYKEKTAKIHGFYMVSNHVPYGNCIQIIFNYAKTTFFEKLCKNYEHSLRFRAAYGHTIFLCIYMISYTKSHVTIYHINLKLLHGFYINYQ